MVVARILVAVLLCRIVDAGVPFPTAAQTARPEKVFLTWMSVTNWLFEVGEVRIVMDGYITRIPQDAFSGPSFATAVPTKPDVPAIRRVIEALGGSKKIDFILTGHSHFDHSFDTAVWAKLTGAQIIGSRSTCLQAVAQGVPPTQCTAVEGGEVLPLNSHVTVRVVRWNHSGDVSTPAGRLLQAPLELLKSPTVQPGAEGLRPGIAQDFPNGGGARAYLFTVNTSEKPVNWLYSNTGNAGTFQHPAAVDEAFFQTQGLTLDNLVLTPQQTSARDNLRAALTAAGLDHVDLWIGYSDRSLAELVCTVLRPKAHIPHHWDSLFSSFFAGLTFPYTAVKGTDELTAFLKTQGVTLLPPRQYMDKYQLTADGVTPISNDEMKKQLGFFNARPADFGTELDRAVVHQE